MTEKQKQDHIETYFESFPAGAVWAIGIGIPLLVVYFIGVIPILLGILAIQLHRKRPSDSEIDTLIEYNLNVSKTKGLEKTGTDESELVGDPLVITGPRFWNTAGASILSKKGEDERLRFTPMNVTVLLLTQHQIMAYQACLDLTTGNFLNESTDEYFYKDVVSVSTKTESKTYTSDDPKYQNLQMNAAETFMLTTSGGTSIETILRDPKLIEVMGGGNIPTTEAERAIQVVRRMLREKKQA